MALSDTKIERALRKTVGHFYAEERYDDLTVKRVRAAAAEELGLDEGWFKAHEDWNARSKEVISSEVSNQESSNAAAKSSQPRSPVEGSKPVPGSRKRSSPDAKSVPRKRTKVEPRDSPEPLEDDSAAMSSVEEGSPPKKRPGKSKPAKGTSESSPLSDVETQPSNRNAVAKNGNEDEEMNSPPARVDDKSESELSSLIDEAPKKRKPREKKKASSSAKPAKKKSSGTKTSAEIDPQEAEIKKLQSWLLKCGIRKLWHRELAPYDTPRAKIGHLKGLLEGVGMTGRFSEQKAREIKEKREMAADLEAITEGNRHWGKDKAGSGSGTEDSEQPTETRGKRLAKGLRDISALIGDDDGEETD